MFTPSSSEPYRPVPHLPAQLICRVKCQQELAFISAGFLSVILVVIIFLSCRRWTIEKNKQTLLSRSRRRAHRRNRSTSQSTWSLSSAAGLNDSFDTDSVTSSVLYGSTNV